MRRLPRHAAVLACAGALTLSVTAAVGTASASPSAPTTPATVQAAAAPAAEVIRATDAPVAVRVGAPQQAFTVTVVTQNAVDGVGASLLDRDGRVIGTTTTSAAAAGRPTVRKTTVQLRGASLTHWGKHSWAVKAWRTSDGSCTLVDETVTTDVRAHSMVGVTSSRSGSTVTVKGSVRAYASTAERYAGWAGRPVSVQRLQGTTWTQVAAGTSDRNGNLTARVSVPKGAKLRLVVKDAASIWGSTSATVTV